MATPGFYLYTGDWLKKTRVLTLNARGAWIDLLVYMNEAKPRGTISWTLDQYARFLSVSRETAFEVLLELQNTQVADVEPKLAECDISVTRNALSQNVTVTSRRMRRDDKIKESNKLRQQRHRVNAKRNASSHGPSSSSSISNSNKNINILPEDKITTGDISSPSALELIAESAIPLARFDPKTPAREHAAIQEARFERFWQVYPNKQGKVAARAAWMKLDPDEALFAEILSALAKQVKWPQWVDDGGRFIPYPATWINQRRWTDRLPDAQSTKRERKFVG